MARSKFYLNFISRPDLGRIQFKAEPVGFDGADFAIIQEEGRMGVDTLFAGGTGKFTFSKMAHPEIFEPLQNTVEVQGFEAVVNLEIDYNGLGTILPIGNLDIFTSDNNTYGLIKVDVILDQEFSKIKKNAEANVNVFSSLDINGNVIQPVQKKKILNPSKPEVQQSKFSQKESKLATTGGIGGVRTQYFNFANSVDSYGIDNTLSYIQGFGNRQDFGYIEAVDTLKNVTLKISELSVKTKETASSYPFGYGYIRLKYAIGRPDQNPDDYASYTVFGFDFDNTPENFEQSIVNGEYTFPNLTVPRGSRLYIYFYILTDTQNTTYFLNTTVSSMKIEITGTKVSYATVNDGLRLIDVVKQVAKSAGLANVSFPRAEYGGYLYDQFIFDGNLLRSLDGKPFNITWKYINDWFPEQHFDYEIQNDGTIFIGNDEDFIANREIYACEKMVFEGYSDNFNPEFGINLFEFKYDNYQSQKENDTANTYDGVHGEAQWKSPNQNVSSTKEVKVNLIRDPFSFEAVRVKSFRTSDNTATQDDDKKYLLDVFPKSKITQNEFAFSETDLLMHSFDDDTQLLTLTNTGSFNWILLGIKVGYTILITTNPTQINQGYWTVTEVASNYVVLVHNGPDQHSSDDNGSRYTNFQYFIKTADIDGIAWTNQDFAQITGILNPESYANLRFTPTRLTLQNWGHHLATINLYQSNKPYINTLYKNNPDLITTIYGVTVKEGENFVPKNPLLSPKIVTVQFLIRFDKYYDIMQKVRSSQRGYIRAFDPDGNPVKLYVQDMKFRQNAGSLGTVTLIGKKKYEKSILDINTNQSNVFISLNGGEYMVEKLRYEIKDNYFYIKDQNGKLMYNRLSFNNISFNGTLPANKSQLINWLNPISEQ